MAEMLVGLLAVVGLCLLAGWLLNRKRGGAPRRRDKQPVATTQLPPNSVVDESRLLPIEELRKAEPSRVTDAHEVEAQEQAEQERLLAEFDAAQRTQSGAGQLAQDEQAAADAARAEEEHLAAIYAEAQREAERQAEEQRQRVEREAAQRAEAERVQAQRVEAERLEAERVEAARLEQQRIEQERAEAERIEAERVEAERVEALRVEAERSEQRRIEAERVDAQRAEAERVEAARVEAERIAAVQAETARLRAEAAAAEAAPPRVLVVDDSKVVRIKTGRLLAAHQFQVAYAVDGLDAVQQLRDALPDLVITDVEMPGMDGFELTRHIRADARSAHLPVIMITAADDRHREHADAVGVSVLLGKPYGEDALIAHIRQALGLAEPQAELQDALA